MKRIILFFIIICLFNIISCSDSVTNSNNIDSDSAKPIIYVYENLDSLKTDNISINHINIKNDILIIDYSYLGRCGTNYINLFSQLGFAETSPVQLDMRLIRHSFSDTCQNVVNGEAYFDLKSALSLWRSTYGRYNGTILLSIRDSNLSNIYLPLPKYVF
jgi:hypothetical protein